MPDYHLPADVKRLYLTCKGCGSRAVTHCAPLGWWPRVCTVCGETVWIRRKGARGYVSQATEPTRAKKREAFGELPPPPRLFDY